MTEISKLLNTVKFSDELNKINEIVDAINTGVSITVDSELSETSENPVQNKVITAALEGKQEILTAGANISISNGVISATDTTYTAGTGISISDEGEISATGGSAEWGNIQGTLSEQTDLMTALNEKQDSLIAGSNISISEGIISAIDTIYTAGTNISISEENVISAASYTAGTGISISEENVISMDNYSYFATCPAITPENNMATWTVTHNLGTQQIAVSLYAGNDEIKKDVAIISNNTIIVTFPAMNNVTAGSHSIVVLAIGGIAGAITPAPEPHTISVEIATGKIMQTKNESMCGYGAATVVLHSSGFAEITYAFTVRNSENHVSGNTAWGLSADLLNSINSNIPLITPVNGGNFNIRTGASGYYSTELGSIHTYNAANGLYWTPSRVTNTSGAFAPWDSSSGASNQFIFTGIAYGTFTP